MKQHADELLDRALKQIHAEEPAAAELSLASRRIADRLGVGMSDANAGLIEGCDDVRRLLPAYRTNGLSAARTQLVAAHLRDCGACLRQAEAGTAALDWRTPVAATRRAVRVPFWHRAGFRWSAVPMAASLAGIFLVYTAFFRVVPGVRAEVQSVDGAAYRISDAGIEQVGPGYHMQEGDRLRTSGGGHAVLRLADGSSVEVNERSVVGVGARGHDTNILLENGDVIVQAAGSPVYVKTADLRAEVKASTLAVDAGLKGSNVAVLQGAADVSHAGVSRSMHAGDAMATYETTGYTPVAQQIAWSHDLNRYLPLLAQVAELQHRLASIALPASRYSSDLLARMPAASTLYVSIPNLGEALAQADRQFQDQLERSPELRQWFDGKGRDNSAQLDQMVAKLHDMSGYLGDEVVLVGLRGTDGASVAIVADVRRNGLEDYLRTQFAATRAAGGLTVLNESTLATAAARSGRGEYALVRGQEVVFSDRLATLREMDRQLGAGAGGFAAGDFGREIAAAYQRGAGFIVAADLEQIRLQATAGIRGAGAKAPLSGSQQFMGLTPHASTLPNPGASALEVSAPRFLLVEHREANGEPENHVTLQFKGPRQGIASWLAAPAPIGSLSFVSPNAAVAVALLAKDPKAMVDDLLAMTRTGPETLDLKQQGIDVNLRNDIAANLGGDFLVALDGPVLPTPAWKLVVEVNNPERLEQAMERMVQGRSAVRIESAEAGGRRFYSVVNASSGVTLAQYTFVEGYLLGAPDRALLLAALHTRATGDSLARSQALKAQLPRDENENYSAVAYQNLSPVLAPLLSQLSGPEADALRQLAVDAKPTAICAWGKADRIEAGSNSHLLGFDFLTVLAMLHHGTGTHAAGVRE